MSNDQTTAALPYRDTVERSLRVLIVRHDRLTGYERELSFACAIAVAACPSAAVTCCRVCASAVKVSECCWSDTRRDSATMAAEHVHTAAELRRAADEIERLRERLAQVNQTTQEVCEIGYINDAREHALISVRNPSLCNCPHSGLVQFALSIQTVVQFRERLDEFLYRHALGC